MRTILLTTLPRKDHIQFTKECLVQIAHDLNKNGVKAEVERKGNDWFLIVESDELLREVEL